MSVKTWRWSGVIGKVTVGEKVSMAWEADLSTGQSVTESKIGSKGTAMGNGQHRAANRAEVADRKKAAQRIGTFQVESSPCTYLQRTDRHAGVVHTYLGYARRHDRNGGMGLGTSPPT